MIKPITKHASLLLNIVLRLVILLVLSSSGLVVCGQSTVISKIDALIDSSEYQSAIELINHSIQVQNNEDSILAIYRHKMGLCYYQLYDEQSALEQFEKSLEIRKKIFDPTHKDIIRLHRNISASHSELHNIEKASHALDQALMLVRKSNEMDTSLMIDLCMQQGRLLKAKREYDRAEDYLLDAKVLCEQSLIIESTFYIEVLELLADVALTAEDASQTIHWAKEVIRHLENDTNDLHEFQFYLANAFHNLGIGYALLDSIKMSSVNFNKSLQINKAAGQERSYFVSLDLSNLALNHKNESNFEKALVYIDRAIDIDIKNEDSFQLMSNYGNKAAILLSAQLVDSAKLVIDEAVDMLNMDSRQQEDKNRVIDVLITKASVEQNIWKSGYSNKEEISKITDNLIFFLDDLRQDFVTDESKLILQERGKEIYTILIESLILVYEYENDYKFLERAIILADDAKSLVLFESVTYSHQLKLIGIPDSLIEQELAIRRTISELESQYSDESPGNDKRTQLLEAREELQRHRSRSKNENKHYKFLSQAYSPEMIDDRFNHFEEPIFEFFLSEEHSYLFFKDGLNMDVFRLPSNEKVYEKATAVRSYISTNVENTNLNERELLLNNKRFTKNAYELYTMLFGSYLDAGHNLPENFVVIPDGILYYIPFEVLVSEVVENEFGHISDFPFLIKKHTIQYIYSAKLNKYVSSSNDIHQVQEVTSFAPSFENSIELTQRNVIHHNQLSNLMYNEDEVLKVSEIVSSKIYAKERATKKTFIDSASRAQILHLATHAMVDQQNSQKSYIAFSLEGPKCVNDKEKNSFMSLSEIQNLDLNASLVVLSACDTGSGEYRKGEGVVSLGRAFIYAGAKSVLMTLWQVDDKATSDIGSDFYNHLKTGVSKVDALRMSKLNFLKNNINKSHPFYWSAPILKGDKSALVLKSPATSFTFYLFGIMSLLILIILLNKFK